VPLIHCLEITIIKLRFQNLKCLNEIRVIFFRTSLDVQWSSLRSRWNEVVDVGADVEMVGIQERQSSGEDLTIILLDQLLANVQRNPLKRSPIFDSFCNQFFDSFCNQFFDSFCDQFFDRYCNQFFDSFCNQYFDSFCVALKPMLCTLAWFDITLSFQSWTVTLCTYVHMYVGHVFRGQFFTRVFRAYGQTRRLCTDKLAPSYSWRLGAKLALRLKVGTYASFKKLPSGTVFVERKPVGHFHHCTKFRQILKRLSKDCRKTVLSKHSPRASKIRPFWSPWW
jgi:hypothetical protein